MWDGTAQREKAKCCHRSRFGMGMYFDQVIVNEQ